MAALEDNINRRDALKRFAGMMLGAMADKAGVASLAKAVTTVPAAEAGAARTIIDKLVRRSNMQGAVEDIWINSAMMDKILADIPHKEFAINGDGLTYYLSHAEGADAATMRAVSGYANLRELKPSADEIKEALGVFNDRFSLKIAPAEIESTAQEYLRRTSLSHEQAATESMQRFEESYQPPAKEAPKPGPWTQRPGLVEPMDYEELRARSDELDGRGGYSR